MALTGKSALITGSLGGIGFATAKALGALGCHVTLNGIAARDVIDARVAELRGLGIRTRHHPADLRHPEQIGLTRAVALEVAQTGITCNAICPGTVLTPAIDWRLRQEMQRDGTSFQAAEEAFLNVRQPSRKFVSDANVAGLIAFLCGPHADDINGSAMPIDGAWAAGR